MLSINNISIAIDDRVIIKDFGITLFGSSTLNLYGPNGIGKTLLLRYLAGLSDIKPNEILFNQYDIFKHSNEYRMLGQYIGHNLGIKEELTAIENIKLWANFYDTHLTIDSAVHVLKLANYLQYPTKTLSQGLKKRLALTRLLITNCPIWFIDEPFTNLDCESQDILLNMIKAKCNQKSIVILTSHSVINDRHISNICLEDFSNKDG